MNYKKLSDMELNLLVASYACKGYQVSPGVRNEKSATITDRWGNDFVFLAVNRPEDSFHLIQKHRIAIIPHGKTRWMAYHDDGASFIDSKPLRAAMIVYLMLMEVKGEF